MLLSHKKAYAFPKASWNMMCLCSEYVCLIMDPPWMACNLSDEEVD